MKTFRGLVRAVLNVLLRTAPDEPDQILLVKKLPSRPYFLIILRKFQI